MRVDSTPEPGTVQNVLRVVLGIFLLTAGIGHLTFAREAFQAQVPNFVPLDKDLTVVVSGVVEVILALSLIMLTRYRVVLGIVIAILFVLVFPGNISQWLHHRDSLGMDTDTKRFVRLFFQPVLIAWVLWSTGAWAAYRGRSRKSIR